MTGGHRIQKQIIPRFEEATGADVRYLISNHPDRLVRLRAEARNPSFHVYFSKFDFVFQAIQLGLLAELSEDLVPGFDRIDDKFKTPYSAGTVYTVEGIYYNPNVMDKPDSWGIFWDPAYKGKIAASRFVDRNVMMASLYVTGGERVDAEEEAWEALEELVLGQEAKVLPSEAFGQMFNQGEVVLANFWQARAVDYKSTGSPVEFSAPKEGTLTEHWAYGIPAAVGDEHKALAGQYIGFATDDHASVAYARINRYPGCKPDTVYPPEVEEVLLTPEEFNRAKSPDYGWVAERKDEWTNRWNRLLTR